MLGDDDEDTLNQVYSS